MNLEKEGWVLLKSSLREPPLMPADNTQDQTNAVRPSQDQNGDDAEDEYLLLPPETMRCGHTLDESESVVCTYAMRYLFVIVHKCLHSR